MTPGSTSSGPDDARAAWNLAQLARLAEAIAELGQGLREQLGGFAPDELHEEGCATLEADRWDAVLDDLCALRDTAEQVGMIGGSFTPHGRALDADVEEIADAAAGTLMEGGSELWMVELAARLLDRERGFPALAEAIEIDPLGCVAGWGETTIDALLGSFHGDDTGRTAYVCATACVSSDARWSNLGVWTSPVLVDTLGLVFASRERMVFIDAENEACVSGGVPSRGGSDGLFGPVGQGCRGGARCLAAVVA